METIQQLYEQNVRSRPASERLLLATLIVNDIPPQSVADYSEIWTDEDVEDFRRASQAHVSRSLEVSEDTNLQDAEKVAAYCKAVLELDEVELSTEYGYSCLPLCVIDAVYSIGVRYEGVRNVLARYREHLQQLDMEEDKHTITEFVQIMQRHGTESCADQLFGNRQRTSTRGGILKAEAVKQFAVALHERGIKVGQKRWRWLMTLTSSRLYMLFPDRTAVSP